MSKSIKLTTLVLLLLTAIFSFSVASTSEAQSYPTGPSIDGIWLKKSNGKKVIVAEVRWADKVRVRHHGTGLSMNRKEGTHGNYFLWKRELQTPDDQFEVKIVAVNDGGTMSRTKFVR